MEWFGLAAEQSPVFYVHHHLIESSLSDVSWARFIRLGDPLLLGLITGGVVVGSAGFHKDACL